MGELVIFHVWTSSPLPVLTAWQTLSALLGLPSLGNSSLARPQLDNTSKGRPHRCGVDCTCSSLLVVFAMFGWVQLHSTHFSGLLFAWVHVESLLSQDVLFYLFKMCCFHRLHLLSRIWPKGKHGEGTKPAPQVQFPWEMQAGISVDVIKC